ncbi:38342_t:CDS:1, partial [Gigaspora margarita]
RIIEICLYFLFCATVGSNTLWTKFYLTALAVFVTLIYRIDTQIDKEIKKIKDEENELLESHYVLM